jgi:hypothetical protein
MWACLLTHYSSQLDSSYPSLYHKTFSFCSLCCQDSAHPYLTRGILLYTESLFLYRPSKSLPLWKLRRCPDSAFFSQFFALSALVQGRRILMAVSIPAWAAGGAPLIRGPHLCPWEWQDLFSEWAISEYLLQTTLVFKTLTWPCHCFPWRQSSRPCVIFLWVHLVTEV